VLALLLPQAKPQMGLGETDVLSAEKGGAVLPPHEEEGEKKSEASPKESSPAAGVEGGPGGKMGNGVVEHGLNCWRR